MDIFEKYSENLDGIHSRVPTPWGWTVVVEPVSGAARVFAVREECLAPEVTPKLTGDLIGFTYFKSHDGGWYTLTTDGSGLDRFGNPATKAIAALDLMDDRHKRTLAAEDPGLQGLE